MGHGSHMGPTGRGGRGGADGRGTPQGGKQDGASHQHREPAQCHSRPPDPPGSGKRPGHEPGLGKRPGQIGSLGLGPLTGLPEGNQRQEVAPGARTTLKDQSHSTAAAGQEIEGRACKGLWTVCEYIGAVVRQNMLKNVLHGLPRHSCVPGRGRWRPLRTPRWPPRRTRRGRRACGS